jgi:hypothetical protein
MTRNPFINALAAIAYIAVVASLMFYTSTLGKMPIDNSVFMPIMVLSLFVFSAAAMGYIFLSQPIMLFLDGQKKEAVSLFLKTSFAFAGCALVLVVLGFYLTSTF